MRVLCLALAVLAGAAALLKSQSPNSPAAERASKSLRAKAEPAPHIELAWAGDLTPGSRYGLPGRQGRQQLEDVRALLRAPDITMVNLEGTLTERGADKCGAGAANCFSFAAPPEYGQGLAWAGVDLANLANNHAFDRGPDGLADTNAALARQGLRSTGAPGVITRLRARGLRVAVVGFAPYPWANDLRDLDGAAKLIRRAARSSDLVWVAMHAGAEGSDQTSTPQGRESAFGEDRGDTRGFAHLAIDSGADLVTGSGPHVVRGMELYKHRLIAYSTGNFAGWNNFGLGGTLSQSAVLSVTLDRQGRLQRGRWHSLLLTGPGAPRPDPAKASASTANAMSVHDFGRRAVLVDARDRLRMPQ